MPYLGPRASVYHNPRLQTHLTKLQLDGVNMASRSTVLRKRGKSSPQVPSVLHVSSQTVCKKPRNTYGAYKKTAIKYILDTRVVYEMTRMVLIMFCLHL